MPSALVRTAVLLLLLSLSHAQLFWPLPQQISGGETSLPLATSFKFVSSSSSETLTQAFARYSQLIFVHGEPNSQAANAIQGLNVDIASSDETLQQETDESYKLSISSTGVAELSAQSIYGALRGLETFSQAVSFDFDAHSYLVNDWNIVDSPRFAFRGLLLDTSRHYEPLSTIFTVIDSMAYAKLNVLHWHAVDDQSFPLETPSYPKLWQGAYSKDQRYTVDDMKSVVEYARLRGVRVMVELDGPGHAMSWAAGYPQLISNSSLYCPLDPTNPFTFQLLEGIYSDFTGGSKRQGIFAEDFFHLGGDEVSFDCWKNSPAVNQWMKDNNFTDYDQLYMYFVKKAHALTLSQGRYPMAWEEVFAHFGSQLDPNVVVDVWYDGSDLLKVVQAGYRGVLSQPWYLDHLSTNWTEMYSVEPLQGITNVTQQQLVIGGKGCMWGETVDTSDALQTIWPRAGAIAERLWSPASVNDVKEATPRFAWFRCLLNKRGIAAAPSKNSDARTAPPQPGNCYDQ